MRMQLIQRGPDEHIRTLRLLRMRLVRKTALDRK